MSRVAAWLGCFGCLAALCACSQDALLGAQCPAHEPACVARASDARDRENGDGGQPLQAGAGGAGAGQEPVNDGSVDAPAALALMIVDAAGWPTTSAELTCDMPCIEVTAISSGDVGGHALTWSDGSSEATRRLCPTRDATYVVSLRDETLASVATASIALTKVQCSVADAGAVDPPDPNACDPKPLVLRALSCSFEGVPDAPLLRAGYAYTVRLRSDLASESMVQLQGWSACSATTIDTVTLPGAPTELERCIPAGAEDRWLVLALFSGLDSAIWTPEGLSGEVCAGCE